jgi:predicted outer membrane repeat protein
MKKFTLLTLTLLMAIILSGQIIHVPADYPTIQQAIDTADVGDTVLVSPGTYVENINFNGKDITVASLFLTTQDTSYISQTIIDGNHAGSVVAFYYGEDSTAMLCGFTVTNGYSGSGGGIYCSNSSSPIISNLRITGNSTFSPSRPQPHPGEGGGIYLGWGSAMTLKNVNIYNNSSDVYGGGIYLGQNAIPIFDSINRCNIYFNVAAEGNDLYSGSFIEMIVDTFTVSVPTEFHAAPISNFSFDILHGTHSQANADLYVSPYGDNNNNGLTVDDPLKTIFGAFSYVLTDSLNPKTIHLLEGTYSPSSNCERFPLYFPDYITLAGIEDTSVILDAENTAGVLKFRNDIHSNISDMTITHGSTAGISCSNSSPIIHDVIIINNNGSGIICNSSSSPELSDVTITGNSANQGGGISCSNSTPMFDSLNRCNIYMNIATEGNDLYSDTFLEVIVDTFTVLYPNEYVAAPFSNFSFDIQHGYHEQLNADLFVSPDGNDANSGLTADEPLKTVEAALIYILPDSLNHNTIHLQAGTYSPSTTGEDFPINIIDYINLTGVAESEVILDAEETASVIRINGTVSDTLSGMTITRGSSSYGSGIYCYDSQPTLKNVTITGNSASDCGGGIYCLYSRLTLSNVSITDNSGGGIYCTENSNLMLQNVIITGNSAFGGGGISCVSSGLTLENVSIIGNSSDNIGGGIYCAYADLTMVNITLNNNSSNYCAGGIYCSNSSLSLTNITISANSAGSEGGGIYCDNSSLVFDTIDRCNIYCNVAPLGNDLYATSFLNVIADTFTVLNPTAFHASPLSNFSFDILHGYFEQVNANLFISPAGDDNNSGLTPGDPLKTIHHALNIILPPNTVYLLEGQYSPSSNGEYFPVCIPENLNLEGEADSLVILDADSTSNVVQFNNNNSTHLSGVTIMGGFNDDRGGGIYFDNSSPSLTNVTITGNSASNHGGGISCFLSNPTLENITISSNSAGIGGGIDCLNSNPMLIDVTLTGNSASLGSGIYCMASSPSLENVTFLGNSSGGGAVLQFSYSSSATMENAIIVGNFGGAISCAYSSYSVLKNVTIAGNSSDGGSEIFCHEGGNVTMINTIMYDDSLPEIYFYPYGLPNSITISNSDLKGGEAGIVTNNNGTVNWLEGNIDEDPLFVNSGENSYALSDGSPCIDTGTPDTTGLNLPPWDIIGNYRIWDGDGDGIAVVDMGAYEYGSIPVGIDNPRVDSRQSAVGSYPNPFCDYTTFDYELEEPMTVTLTIFNHLGQQIEVLINEHQSAGTHQVRWNAEDLPAGVYFYRLSSTANRQLSTGKIVVVK